jgi:hypothetical protein
MRISRTRPVVRIATILTMVAAGAAGMVAATSLGNVARAATTHDFARVAGQVPKYGELDCNGFSPVQRPRRPMLCTDIRGIPGAGNQNSWDGRFFDNGHYIGHDEPDATFISNRPGSGNNVSWHFKIGQDPAAMPNATHPGHDVARWFELSPAPWLSMALCNPHSYPQLPCKPNSDRNAPRCRPTVFCKSGQYPGGGSAFMELQFYPPGNAPFYDNESCDNTHWCVALTIDSLECTENYASCNVDCEEPVNFAFVQTNGVPDTSGGGFVPDNKTLLINPGDSISVHIYDAPAPADPAAHLRASKALKVVVKDETTGKSGFIQASAKNGFVYYSMSDCSAHPFNFQPEYNTAARGNYVPWAALQTNISTEFEIGHFEPCASLSDPFPNNDDPPSSSSGPNPFDESDVGGSYNKCVGGYEPSGASEGPETADGICYAAGDTHPGYAGPGTSSPPNEVTGCQDNYEQNGDLDFDGIDYYPEWPTGVSPTSRLPGSFVETLPTTRGNPYSEFFLQSDVGLSEYYSPGCRVKSSGCTIPPKGPGHFYPYWSMEKRHGVCYLLFGNVTRRANDLGKDKQYGWDRYQRLGFPEFEGRFRRASCPAKLVKS